jgi:D-arabinose 1-dehydrogenase-like Zn-dependent alcohol dehydrogenase
VPGHEIVGRVTGVGSAEHDINAYIHMLRLDGNLTLVGAPAKPIAVSAFGRPTEGDSGPT